MLIGFGAIIITTDYKDGRKETITTYLLAIDISLLIEILLYYANYA